MNSQPNNNSGAIAMMMLLFCLVIAGMISCIYFGVYEGGLNGGSLGCAIFASTALYGIIKIYIAKTN